MSACPDWKSIVTDMISISRIYIFIIALEKGFRDAKGDLERQDDSGKRYIRSG
jgi:hypothetical protein